MVVQGVVDACLFEPGLWQATYVKSGPASIPMPLDRRAHFATPLGLLFNELQHTAHAIADPLERMLDLAL